MTKRKKPILCPEELRRAASSGPSTAECQAESTYGTGVLRAIDDRFGSSFYAEGVAFSSPGLAAKRTTLGLSGKYATNPERVAPIRTTQRRNMSVNAVEPLQGA